MKLTAALKEEAQCPQVELIWEHLKAKQTVVGNYNNDGVL